MLSNLVGVFIILLGTIGLAIWVFIARQVLKQDPLKRDVGLIGPMIGIFSIVLFRYVYTRVPDAIVFYLGMLILVLLFYLIFTGEFKFKNVRLTRILNILSLIGLFAFMIFLIRAGWYKIFMNY